MVCVAGVASDVLVSVGWFWVVFMPQLLKNFAAVSFVGVFHIGDLDRGEDFACDACFAFGVGDRVVLCCLGFAAVLAARAAPLGGISKTNKASGSHLR